MRSGAFPVPLELAIGVQTALAGLGFDPHGLDGIIGPGARSALLSFQASVGLPQTPGVTSVDGIPPEAMSALAAGLDDKAALSLSGAPSRGPDRRFDPDPGSCTRSVCGEPTAERSRASGVR
ncbi:peptidoglycan-binding domain-containing protein [Streptomyces collinus]|uniref:peptidoglycan-binding domain-containing protein n=1 Tax=Streptomyces collinus TaxID=42684 RepID=UPI003411B678